MWKPLYQTFTSCRNRYILTVYHNHVLSDQCKVMQLKEAVKVFYGI